MQQAPIPNPLDSMLERIDACMHTQPEEALRICDEVFELARSLRQPAAYVTAAERYGRIMDHLGRGSESRNVLFAAQQVAQSALLFANEAKLLEEIARSYYTGGQYRLAIQYWARCVEVSDQANRDARTWILAKVGLSQVYFSLGDFESGLALLQEAESRIHEVDDPHLDAKIKINLGVDLVEAGRPQEAYTAFLQALDICSKSEFFDYTAESSFRLGQLELLNGDLDAAMKYLDSALVNARRINYRWCEAQVLTAQAEIHARRKDCKKALGLIKEAQTIALTDGFRHMLAQQHFAAASYAEANGDFAEALVEYKAGHTCELQIREASVAENKELEETAGLRPSVNRLLVDLSNNRLIDEGQLDPAFRLITQEGSRILEVARASIWMLDQQTGTLVCRCLYIAAQAKYGSEAPLRRQDCPTYFARISDHNPLVAHDAMHHPHTWELEQLYLKPYDIRSMLVFPIRVTSQTAGLLCLEAVGVQRNWTPDDIAHASQLTEVTARVLSGYERKLLQQEINGLNAQLLQANDLLKSRVIERTAALERHNAELHALNDRIFEMKRQLLAMKPMACLGQLSSEAMNQIETATERISSGISQFVDSRAIDIQAMEDLRRIKNIAGDLRKFSHAEREPLAAFELHNGIDAALNLVNIEQHQRAKVFREFGDLPPVECHSDCIIQVFVYLLLNASDSLPHEGGEIRISTGCSNNEVSIAISDNGCGIPAQNLPKIFDAFFTTKASSQAAGLGLPLCYTIIQSHHGRIEANSKEGAGTTITIRLPVKQPAV
jgi:signal transduction histidine kinase/Flp pilus assembly protein TadD